MPRYYLGDDLDQILGDDEILGDDDESELMGGDDDEILGDDVYLGGRRRRTKLPASIARNAVLVRRQKPKVAQEQVVPFPATSVNAAATADIQADPQRTFRTERFVVASAIAAFFVISDLRIGRESMLVNVGDVPAQIFSEVGVGVRLRGYTANLGNTIVVSVENIDAAAQTFRAAIIGTTLV